MMLLVLLLAASPGDCLLIPPNLEGRLIYYRSFSADAPEVDALAGQAVRQPEAIEAGWAGRGARTADASPLVLKSAFFSPDEPLSIAFWWALEQECGANAGYSLLHLAGGNRFVSLFGRGGPWCALDDTAAVLQVYNLPGIQNVNGIYDRAIREHLSLQPNVWHHTTLTFAGGNVVRLYTDGQPTYRITLTGRAFAADDALHELALGSRYGSATLVDEVAVWRRTLSETEVADWYPGMIALHEAGHLN